MPLSLQWPGTDGLQRDALFPALQKNSALPLDGLQLAESNTWFRLFSQYQLDSFSDRSNLCDF